MLHWLEEYSVIFFDEIDSTNLEAKRLIATGAKGKFVIIATKQMSGRGKDGKFWHSPAGNLYFSIVLNHETASCNLSQLSLITSLSCYEAIENISSNTIAAPIALAQSPLSESLKIKWPNDLLLNDKKLCGILLQTIPYINQNKLGVGNNIIIGIGINTTSSPKNIKYPTTSLKESKIIYHSNNEILHQIMQIFNKYYKFWKINGFSAIRYKWMQHAYKLGEKISVSFRGKYLSGLFKEIDSNGYMIVELKSGALHKIATCDMQII